MAVQLDDSRPTYLQVADTLRDEISSGTVGSGERIPSVRDLAARFDIAGATVQSALRVLRDEGYISSRSTRGYFVRDQLPTPQDRPSDEFTAIRSQLEALTTTMRELTERVGHLEDAVLPAAHPPPGESPARAGRSDD
ncbi:MAG: GntR family transcriptional regulator [Actinomycetota bacterium]|nr:GntR family transcriptional regulator [Actinomycetota bacterium]